MAEDRTPAGLRYCIAPGHQGDNPLPAAAFGKNRAKPDGIETRCKACKNTAPRKGSTGQAVRENRSRRGAARRGLSLNKIQRRDEGALGYGRWLLHDGDQLLLSHVVRGIEIGASLEEIEAWLRGGHPSA
jgi:hypothetical protein